MSSSKRLISLDVFRGLTVALMIIVNSPGNETPFIWLEHSSWNGCTLADMVFPFFVFIMGFSTSLSLMNQQAKQVTKSQLLGHILYRSLLLFGLGLLLNAFPYHFYWQDLRLTGVLQRLAVCYLISALAQLYLNHALQMLITMAILVFYYLFLIWMTPAAALFPLPAQAYGWVSQLDQWFIPLNHLYRIQPDPEGLVSMVPALASVLMGNIFAHIWQKSKSVEHFCWYLSIGGVSLCMLGWLTGLFLPINKSLWTSSYVLWTSGLACFIFALCCWVVEIKQQQKGLKFFRFLGLNALAAYMLHVMLLKWQVLTIIKSHGEALNVKAYLTEVLFSNLNRQMAAFFYAFCFLIFCYFVLRIYVFLKSDLVINKKRKLKLLLKS